MIVELHEDSGVAALQASYKQGTGDLEATQPGWRNQLSTAFLSVAPRVDGGRFGDGSTEEPRALYGAALVTRGRRGGAAAGARGGGLRE
jgi:hypothetical protein